MIRRTSQRKKSDLSKNKQSRLIGAIQNIFPAFGTLGIFRPANVSKTVLTQCNTVICFQAFDETSFTFLGNYVGRDMVQALPNLKQYHAVLAGKAVKSNMPIIIDLTRT